jgi:mannose-6-phosphate isomerase-like protein (cupin superfamily)
MVLEGELFFKFKDRVICVKKGDVIAIPSNTPYEAFTKNSPVLAVDAWSPVMEKYRQEKKDNNVLENERILVGCCGMKP